MNLLQLRNEVLNHGFDPNEFNARITQYLNDGMNLIARRVDYYQDEAAYDFTTVAGTTSYALPADWARIRSLRYPSLPREVYAVSLRDIDRYAIKSGQPTVYALDSSTLHLYPTPDGVYSLELRYWKMPAQLVADTDVPSLPADWHHILWVYATWICYEGEDDPQMGQYWQGRFASELSMFTADQKFPDTNYPTQVQGMWDSGASPAGWSLWSGS